MAVETIEGVWQDVLHYHYDVPRDVLYLRLNSRRDEEVYGEEDDHGFYVMHSLADDTIVGMTIVDFWQQHGEAPSPALQSDLVQRLEQSVADLSKVLMAA